MYPGSTPANFAGFNGEHCPFLHTRAVAGWREKLR